MQSVNADVFLSSALLRFDQPGGPVDANDEAAGDLRVEGSGVTGLLHTKNPLNPGDNLVGTRIGRLVEIENSAFDVLRKWTLHFIKKC